MILQAAVANETERTTVDILLVPTEPEGLGVVHRLMQGLVTGVDSFFCMSLSRPNFVIV